MRQALREWGKARWPEARVVEELVVAHECRIDMAFISPNHLAGVEIKSSRDTLDRLDNQVKVFRGHIPEFWLAIHPRWNDRISSNHDAAWRCNRLIVDVMAPEPNPVIWQAFHGRAIVDRTLTAPLLHILWRNELLSIARRRRFIQGTRGTMAHLIPILARGLTGDELIESVCEELRNRDAQWTADPPIARPKAARVQTQLSLLTV